MQVLKIFKQLSNILRSENENQKGFTIIELLVVTMILGILAGISFALLNPSVLFGQARDTTRKSDLKAIATALQLYYGDNRAFPSFGTYNADPTPSTWVSVSSIGLTTSYIKSIPIPSSGGKPASQTYYEYLEPGANAGCGDNQAFALRASLERGTTDPQAHKSGTTSTYKYWCDGTTSIGSSTTTNDDGYYYVTSN